MARVNHRQGVFAYRVILHVRAVKPCLIFHRQGAGEARYAMYVPKIISLCQISRVILLTTRSKASDVHKKPLAFGQILVIL